MGYIVGFDPGFPLTSYGNLDESLHHSKSVFSVIKWGNDTYIIALKQNIKFLVYSRCSYKGPYKYYYPECLGFEFHYKCSGGSGAVWGWPLFPGWFCSDGEHKEALTKSSDKLGVWYDGRSISQPCGSQRLREVLTVSPPQWNHQGTK